MRICVEDSCFAFVLVFLCIKFGNSLECVQCDRRGQWFSPEENERHIAKCQNGLIEPTKCLNATHTHCIYSFYRQGASSNLIVTERRCGVEEDILGCTLYKSSRRRMKRHFLGSSDTTLNSHKRRETALFVEVCTEGCMGDGCISSSSRTKSSLLIVIVAYCFHVIRVQLF